MTKKKPAASPKKSAAAKPARNFAGVFAALKEILEPYEKLLHVLPYKPEYYCLVTRLPVHKGKPMWFAAIRMGKNYVSYHFMPVYMFPKLRERMSDELRARMQGKSCFNFKVLDETLLKELDHLTTEGFAMCRKAGFAPEHHAT